MPVDATAPSPRPAPAPVGRARTVGEVTCRPVTLYTMNWDGALWWMRDTNPFSTSDLPQRGRTAVGHGFGIGYATSFFGASGNGVLYRVDANGRLFWYRHLDPVGGRATWANSGRPLLVGAGLRPGITYSVAVGPRGDLYVITIDGVLWLYRHTGWLTGAGTWANGGRPIRLGTGFQWNDRVLPAGGGVLYVSRADRRLSWFRYTLSGPSGSAVHWAAGGVGRTVGREIAVTGVSAATGGAGVLYQADYLRTLTEYRHLDPSTGRATWDALHGRYVAATAVVPHTLGIGLAADPTACTAR
jgi:hypothetical protein